mmetsp:Transcript_29362/g.40930  ORF Transcript_29362/g.40930 Transcript_29362/m.40930 type:complete len:228 (+) Transcript_29362:485-1168(+)
MDELRMMLVYASAALDFSRTCCELFWTRRRMGGPKISTPSAANPERTSKVPQSDRDVHVRFVTPLGRNDFHINSTRIADDISCLFQWEAILLSNVCIITSPPYSPTVLQSASSTLGSNPCSSICLENLFASANMLIPSSSRRNLSTRASPVSFSSGITFRPSFLACFRYILKATRPWHDEASPPSGGKGLDRNPGGPRRKPSSVVVDLFIVDSIIPHSFLSSSRVKS